MKKLIVALILLIGVIAGCSSKKEEQQAEPSLEIIEVNIQIPETINPNEEAVIQAVVTQGKEKVDDANEVKFEIEKVGQQEHEMLEAKNEGKGVYSINKTFTENGKYIVTSHVTARGMHSMPNKEFTVGTVEEDHSESDAAGHEGHEASQNDQATGHGHHDSTIEILFNQDSDIAVNKEALLKTTIKHEGSPLLGAKVRYEVLLENENTPQWIETNEDGEGSYSATNIFKKAGMYHLQIHVNKDEIHDHKIVMINVK
ncbi:FixH family protein [Bacillus sp. CGMCC 1.16607]|uniref:FixH family protein n=1 Tax=Bacillus sp. CGMCC 1.16607 TaxID=3351842 RepID=UPI00362B8898